MSIILNVSALKDLNKIVSNAEKRLSVHGRAATAKAAAAVATALKQAIHVAPKPYYRSKDRRTYPPATLKQAIRIFFQKNAVGGTTVSKHVVFFGEKNHFGFIVRFLEYGTKYSKPYPFIKEVEKKTDKEVQNIIRESLAADFGKVIK